MRARSYQAIRNDPTKPEVLVRNSVIVTVSLLFFAAFFSQINLVAADSIKMKNGSYFEGRIVEDNGESVKVKLGVGIVEFPKNEVEEIIDASEEENMEIEKRWEMMEPAASPIESKDESVEAYINQGKVKYQGRWITQEAYEVIKKEQDIKEKRYRFLEEKKKEDEKRRREETQRQMQLVQNQQAMQQAPSFGPNAGTPGLNTGQTSQNGFGQTVRFHRFGEVLPEPGTVPPTTTTTNPSSTTTTDPNATAATTTLGLGKISTFGKSNTKPYVLSQPQQQQNP